MKERCDRKDENRERQLRVTVDNTGMISQFTIPTNALEEDDETPESDELEFAGSAVVAIGKLKDALDRMGDSARAHPLPGTVSD